MNGDICYIGSPTDVWALTGSNRETFQIQRMPFGHGFMGMRSFTVHNGKSIGIVTRQGFAAAANNFPEDTPENIAIMSGASQELIGDRVLSLIRQSTTQAWIDCHAKSWPTLGGVLFLPRRAGSTAAARDMLFWDDTSGTFWEWNIASAVSPNALEFADNILYMVTQDSRLKYFDTAEEQDDGTDMTSYWGSGLIVYPEGFPRRKFAIDRAIVFGTAGTGTGDATFSVSAEGGAFQSMGTFALAAAGTEINIAGRDNNNPGYFQNVRATFAAGRAGSTIRRVSLLLKPIGNPVS